MCGGGRETHDIEEAEKMDLDEQKKKSISTNVQISMVIRLMQESEQDLFSEKLKRIPMKIWLDREYDLEDAWWDAIK